MQLVHLFAVRRPVAKSVGVVGTIVIGIRRNCRRFGNDIIAVDVVIGFLLLHGTANATALQRSCRVAVGLQLIRNPR